MKKEHISDALNMLNDDIIEETNNVRTNAKPKRKWVKWGVVAACLCLAVTIAIPDLKIDEILNDKMKYSRQVKTKNALRRIPVHIEIEDILQRRKEFVQRNIGTKEGIGE